MSYEMYYEIRPFALGTANYECHSKHDAKLAVHYGNKNQLEIWAQLAMCFLRTDETRQVYNGTRVVKSIAAISNNFQQKVIFEKNKKKPHKLCIIYS